MAHDRAWNILSAVIIAATLFFAPDVALAHKVGLYAYVEDGQIKGQAYFAGGGKAVNSPVAARDGAGKDLGQAVTDDQGRFSLPLPAGVAPPLRLTLLASQGHQASYEIPASELSGAAPSAPAPASAAETSASAPGPGLDSAELERVVAKVVGEKLAPLNAQVARLAGERQVTVHDIAAGIGYILGLFGLAAWFKSRRK
ncbi:MAG: hypothetical protein ACOZHQ_09695 [Thermodesulfobacteriota bacterium]